MPRFLGYAANTACKCIFDLTAISSIGWQASPKTSSNAYKPHFALFVDAALNQNMFMTGIFSPHLGIQVHAAPPSVTTQQMAELFALQYGIRLAHSLKLLQLHLFSDNKGALFSLSKLKGRPMNHVQTKLLRQIFNMLWWSRMPVTLYWIPTHLRPADPSSRLYSYIRSAPFQAFILATQKYHTLLSTNPLSAFAKLEM